MLKVGDLNYVIFLLQLNKIRKGHLFPSAAILAKFISTKPGLITINEPINPIITAAHLLNPTFSPNKTGDKIVTIKGAIKANVSALDKDIIDIE